MILEESMVTDIVCQIHYCNGQKLQDPVKDARVVTRTLQHHEMIFICEGSGHIVMKVPSTDLMVLCIISDIISLMKYSIMPQFHSYDRDCIEFL